MINIDEILRQIAFVERPKSICSNELFRRPVENERLGAQARGVVDRLAESAIISVSLAFDDSESGFASYVGAFCFRSPDLAGRNLRRDLPKGQTQGLCVSLSLCGPYATVSRASIHVSGISVGFGGYPVDLGSVLTSATDDLWNDVLDEILPKIESGGFRLLWKNDLAVEIPDGIHIDTINNAGPKFSVFDLLFSWMD